MNNPNDSVFEAISDLASLSTDLVIMESIPLDRFIQTARKRTMLLRKGDMVRVEHDQLVDCDHNNPPTHLILECRGTIYSGDLQMDCEDLNTQEIIIVKL